MIRKEHDGVVWLEFEHLSQYPKLKHGVFLRHGGYSTGQFSSLNLSYRVGDLAMTVHENERKIANILGVKEIIRGNFCHGKDLVQINERSQNQLPLPPCDGLMTNLPNLGLLVTHADCQAAIFYDPKNHKVACVHSGWRGSVQNIYAETVAQMKKYYNTSPKDLLVGISPSLGPNDSEFVNYRSELPQNFWDYQIKPTYFDFWAISRMQLSACGIPSENIEISNMSTYSNPQDCFSYRRDKKSGRHATVAALD